MEPWAGTGFNQAVLARSLNCPATKRPVLEERKESL